MEMETNPTPLVYDREATIVLNELPEAYYEKRLTKRTAGEISRVWRDEERYRNSSQNLTAKISFAEQYLKENYDELEEHADEIAKILGIDLTNEVEIDLTVRITGTITLPMGKSFSDLSEYDFDVELSCNEMDYELENYDADIITLREG